MPTVVNCQSMLRLNFLAAGVAVNANSAFGINGEMSPLPYSFGEVECAGTEDNLLQCNTTSDPGFLLEICYDSNQAGVICQGL